MYRYRYLIAAIILAVIGARLTGSYIQRLEQQAAGEGPRAQVVLAKTTIPKGTEIQPSLLESEMWPVAMVPQGAVSEPTEVVGQYALADVMPGEVVMAHRVGARDDQGLVWHLAPGERAIAVSISGISGLESELALGSRVDVLGTLLDYRTGLEHSLVVLEDIPLLGISAHHDPYGAVLGKQTVVLAVSPDQAKRLALFDSSGSLQLLLRPHSVDSSLDNRRALTTEDILGSKESHDELEALIPLQVTRLPDMSQLSADDLQYREVEVVKGTTASLESVSEREASM